MDRKEHIATLKKLIQENEKSLADMKAVVAELEDRRKESLERHAERMTVQNSSSSAN